jgi:hypothetical protein
MDDDRDQPALPPAPPPAPPPEIPSRPPLDEDDEEEPGYSTLGPIRYLWRDKEPTEKQLRFLREHGHYRPVANRGEASDLIAAAFRQEKKMRGYLMILLERTAYPGRIMMNSPPFCHIDLSKLDIPRIADLIPPKGA